MDCEGPTEGGGRTVAVGGRGARALELGLRLVEGAGADRLLTGEGGRAAHAAVVELDQAEGAVAGERAGEAAQAGWSTFASQCTSCHRITGMTDPSDPTSKKLFEYPPVVNQVAGEVPNLTKLMTRTTFAGAKFNLRLDTPKCRALGESWASTQKGIDQCFNREQFEAWLRNAPAMKAMHPGEAPSPESRGMNNFNLSEDQMAPILGIACPQIVYPYLRSNVADIVQRAGFPPVHLAEINFQQMYEQQQGGGEAPAVTQ